MDTKESKKNNQNNKINKKKKKEKKFRREVGEAVVIALILAIIIRAFVIQAFKIPSSSMEDTLLIGDHLLVSKFSYGIQVPKPAIIRVLGVPVPFFETWLYPAWGEVKTGDVVVFRFPGDRSKDFIKRTIGTPGDRVEVRDKVIFLNGKKMDDPHSVFKGSMYGGTSAGDNFGPYLVPDDHIFVMGDNRDNSHDSRWWGPVPIKELRGKAFIIYVSRKEGFPWFRFGRTGQKIE
ncbi:MAG: signal peptidase I [Deltaproteobacteria bacterium]|nr:signal peptidase I [Deltaproteobacteria bacterium]